MKITVATQEAVMCKDIAISGVFRFCDIYYIKGYDVVEDKPVYMHIKSGEIVNTFNDETYVVPVDAEVVIK